MERSFPPLAKEVDGVAVTSRLRVDNAKPNSFNTKECAYPRARPDQPEGGASRCRDMTHGELRQELWLNDSTVELDDAANAGRIEAGVPAIRTATSSTVIGDSGRLAANSRFLLKENADSGGIAGATRLGYRRHLRRMTFSALRVLRVGAIPGLAGFRNLGSLPRGA